MMTLFPELGAFYGYYEMSNGILVTFLVVFDTIYIIYN